jgi:uncharacterized protein HemX
MRRSAAIVLSGVLLALAVTIGGSAAVLAQEQPATTTTPPANPGIVIKPNTGSAPTDAGDRGGALQSALFVIVVAGIGVIGYLIVRESRKARASRGF